MPPLPADVDAPIHLHRRLFLPAPFLRPPSPPYPTPRGGAFDSNAAMILAALVCALVCALGLNSIVRCALRVSSPSPNPDIGRERSGATSVGVGKEALRSMPTVRYPKGEVGSDCAICLSEFGEGEKVRVLPLCNHGFHVKCVDRWLAANSTCPTCRQCLLREGGGGGGGLVPQRPLNIGYRNAVGV